MNQPTSQPIATGRRNLGGLLAAGALAVSLFASGCGGKPPAPAAAPAKSSTAAKAPVASSAEGNAPAGFPKSVFVKNPLKNPFYPARPEVRAVESAQPTVADTSKQLRDKLSAGFMGVMGAGEERMAVINDIFLQVGKDAEIPVTMDDGKIVVVKVKCLKILRNSVQLKVDGQEKPVTVTLTPKFK